LPYPFGGVFYTSEDPDAPILFGVFNGSQDIRLTLPEEVKVSSLKWFSVWSRSEKKSFGEVIFPSTFSLNRRYPTGSSINSGFGVTTQSFRHPDSTETYSNTDLPPPLVSGNVHDPRRVDHFADHDPQAEAEPETSDDADHADHVQERFQPRRNGACGLAASLSVIAVAALSAKFL
jgi:hypothetical protein